MILFDLFDGKRIEKYTTEQKEMIKSIIPELVKRLITASCPKIKKIRILGMNDISAPGYDGVVENGEENQYVCSGLSVWEFGTSCNSLKKINEDFAKRTKDSLGINKETTEFYFVIPYIWPYNNQGNSLTKWEQEHKECWKATHIIDATILGDWLNSEPEVAIWFIEQFEKTEGLSLCSVSKAWHRFSSKTDPAFSYSLFLSGREKEVDDFLNHLNEKKTSVKADTSIDAYGFCLAALSTRQDLLKSVIVVNDYKTYKKISEFYNGKHLFLNFKLNDDLIDRNNNIFCYNKEDQTAQADIVIMPQPKSIFDKCIKEMGLEDGKVGNLYKQTHGNLLSLIRRIPGNSTEGCPKWASQNDISLLAPLMLLRFYNAKSDFDRNLVSSLANEKYDLIEERYNSWSRLEDAPLKKVENTFVLNNYEESWNALKINASMVIFKRYISLLKRFFTNQLDYNITFDSNCSLHLYYLFVNLVYFSRETDGIVELENGVKELLDSIKPDLIADYLSICAEATPEVVKNYLVNDYNSNNGLFENMFKECEHSTDYCKLLSAIDELVLHEETRICACDLLFDLCEKTQLCRLSTSSSPRESLLKALCLWNNYSPLLIDEKVKLIERYIKKDPDYFYPFLVELLLKQRFSFPLRTERTMTPKYSFSWDDLIEVHNKISSIVFLYCTSNNKCEELKKLLNCYSFFSEETLMFAADNIIINNYTIHDILSLNHVLRIQAYNAGRDDKESHYIPVLKYWIEKTTPPGDIGSILWLFYDYNSCKLSMNDKNDLDNDEQLYKCREKIFINIIETHPEEDLIQLISYSIDSVYWGWFYAKNIKGALFQKVAHELLINNKRESLIGMVDYATLEDCVSFLNSIPEVDQCKLLNGVNRKDIINSLDTEKKEQSYWGSKIMREYDETTFEKLLRYNPFNLLPYYAYFYNGPFVIEIDKIKKILDAIVISNNIKPANRIYDLETIIEKLSANGLYSEEWADICVNLYDLKLIKGYPSMLRKYYFYNPVKLCERLISKKADAFPEFTIHYELPEQAYEDEDSFTHFVDTLLDKQNEDELLLIVLGRILGKVRDDEDGIFPHRFVRNIIEKYRNRDLNDRILNGKVNSRGVWYIQDGIPGKVMSEKYYSDAKLIEIDYPETSRLLRRLGDECMFVSKHDQIYSEISL